MRAELVRDFGPPSAILPAEVPRPDAAEGQVLVRVNAAGVGPWDALIREGKSVVEIRLPVILGSDFSGVVAGVGKGVTNFEIGEEVWGVTNEKFIGAYAEYACASAKMIGRKPKSLNFLEAASAPVVAVTAWQMLFEYARVSSGQVVLIHGAAGNVGAYAVQLAENAGIRAIATASERDANYVRQLGADEVIDYRKVRFENAVPPVDAVIDTVGGEVRERSLRVLKPQGKLISIASPIPDEVKRGYGDRAVFFLVDVSTERLKVLQDLFDKGNLHTDVGTVLPLEEARKAHEMLAGAPHERGKIVLQIAS